MNGKSLLNVKDKIYIAYFYIEYNIYGYKSEMVK